MWGKLEKGRIIKVLEISRILIVIGPGTDTCLYRENGEVLAAVVRRIIPLGAYGGGVPFGDVSPLDKAFQLNLFAKKEKQS